MSIIIKSAYFAGNLNLKIYLHFFFVSEELKIHSSVGYEFPEGNTNTKIKVTEKRL